MGKGKMLGKMFGIAEPVLSKRKNPAPRSDFPLLSLRAKRGNLGWVRDCFVAITCQNNR